MRTAEIETPKGSAAGLLAGLIWGAPVGGVATWFGSGGEQIAVGFGIASGAVVGMILGRAFGKIDNIFAAAAFGAFVPLMLIVIDAARRGRLPANVDEVTNPQALTVLACVAGGGALVAALLCGTAKALRGLGMS